MLKCAMLSQKLLLVIIGSTLLLQRCSSDQALSTLKTSSGRSAYLDAKSKSSNTEITSDSFSHSDSSLAASQSETSQSDSSIVNTSDGISLQDSNSYSSNSSVSGSNSDIVATDEFISQTESSFESTSSTNAESDTSLTATPNGSVVSSTTSSSTSMSSSSSTSSRSISEQFLDARGADISFPDEDFPFLDSSHKTKSLDSIPDFPGRSPGLSQFPDFPNSGSSHQTKSLDSIPDFPGNSPGPHQFTNFPNSKFPSSLDSKPFPGSQNSKFPSNFPKFPNSLNNSAFKKYDSKNPYAPAGAFNSRLTPRIGTPVGPAGMSSPLLPQTSDNLLNSPDISKLPLSPTNSALNSPVNSDVGNSLPINSLPDSQFPSNTPTLESLQQPLNTQSPMSTDITSSNSPLDSPILTSADVNENLNLINDSQSPLPSLIDNQPISPDLLHDNLTLNDISSLNSALPIPSSDLPNSPLYSDLPNSPLYSDVTNNDNVGIPNSPIQPSNLSTNPLDNNVPIEFPSNTSSQTSELYDSSIDSHPPSPYDSLTKSSENHISNDFHPDMPSPIPELQDSSHLYPNSPYDSYINSENDSPTDIPLNSLNTPVSSIISTDQPLDNDLPTKNLPNYDDIPTPVAPYDSNLYPDDLIPSTNQYSTQPIESMDIDQNGEISPDEILQSNIPSTPTTLGSMDLNQDGFISPEEILESSNHTPTTSGSIDLDQNGLISPEEILDSSNPTPTAPESIDLDQNGFISTDEILESNNPLSPSPTFFSLDNTEQLEISDSPYLPQTGYEDTMNLPNEFSPIDQTLAPPYEQSPPLPYEQLPLYQPNIGSPKPNISPYDQLPTPQETYLPKPPYSGFNKPYFGPKRPLPLQNTFPSPQMGPHFPKYPPYPPYFKGNYSPLPYPPYYSSPYNKPIIPSPYNYPGSLLQPLLPLNHPYMSDFYNTSPPFSPGNPLLNRPPYSYPGSPYDVPPRPYYKPKDWSRIPTLKGSPYLPNTLSPLSPGGLNSSPYNQPLTDLPADSLLPQSPADYSSLPLSPASLDSSPYNQPLTDLPADLLLPQSPNGFPLSDMPSGQPLTSLNSAYGSPFSVPDSPTLDDTPQIPSNVLPSNSLDLNNSPLSTPASPYPSQDFTNSPLIAPVSSPSTLPNYSSSIDDEIFDILKQTYERTTAEYQLSNSIYPRDISINFDTMTDAELTYNFVVLGSSPAALSALKKLLDTGKSVLVIERGNLPPHISHSLYYRPKILQSDYVRKIRASAPHCDTEKILYVPNVLGEESTYDSNVWDYGVKSKYIKWGKLSKKWTWSNVIEYFTDGYDQPNTCLIPVTTEIENTRAVNAVTSIFNDAGLYRTEYQKGKRLEGLTVVPYLHENGENVVLAEKIFQQLTSFNNVQLALETTPESIVFDDIGKAIGVLVKTSCGKMRTITILDELIIGSNPVDAVQFLYQSGIGDHDRLQQLNIPTQINLPYVGKELVITPLHFGVIYLFPQGTLLSETESDFAGTDYLFGKYGLPSALSVDYLKAALNIYGAHEANVIFNFRVFSKSMSERLRSYIERLKHIDIKIKDFLTNLCQDYDILLAVPQLTNVLSRGEIIIDNSSGIFEALVDTGMYKSKRDITIMQKALKVLKSIAETEAFKLLNGKVVQIPVQQCGVPDFSTEYNRCSIRYLSLPNLHCSGGTIMGVSPLTSVVNEDLLVHGTKNVRIFSASVVPYGTSTDSSAVSSMIGNLGAHILRQNYLQ